MSEPKKRLPGFFTRHLIFLQLFGESIAFALNSLRVNKLRSFLSLLGIAIGIFLIISVFTAVDSLENNIRDSIKSISNNAVYIQKWPWIFGGEYPWWKYINRPLPGIKEMDELQKRINTASYLAYVAEFNAKTIKYQNNTVENSDIAAVSHDYIRIRVFELASGRYFSEEESESGKPFAVIGSEIAGALFPDVDPVGKSIDIMGRKVQVIGVIKKEGSSIIGTSRDETVIVPVNYARNIVNLRSDRIDPFILVQAKEFVSLDQLKDDLKGAMRAVRKLRPKEDDDFALNESTLASDGFAIVFQSINKGGWFIGLFSILVGGFGIFNIMFVSVKERTSIIGIQKSLGAKSYFILLQFLSESVILCLIGGAMGLLLVFPLSLLATNVMDFNFTLSQSNVIVGLSISGFIGIIAGAIPAYFASQMNPVDAIRSN